MKIQFQKLELSALFLFCLFNIATAQMPDHLYDFEKFDVIDYCWENKNPKYSETEFPEEWKNESAVYLHFENYYETKETSAKGRGISFIAHRRIKILDQAALDDFSEIFYVEGAHGNYVLDYGMYQRQKNFLGVKVIKPDGKEVKMKSSDIIKDDDGRKKVAVSNLEIGDILDYYLYTYDYTYGTGIYAIYDKFTVHGKYPIRHFDYRVTTDPHWDVKFITNNDELEIEEKKTGKKSGDFSFSIAHSDLDAASAQLWNYSFRSSTYLKLLVQHKAHHLKQKEQKNQRPLRTNALTPEKVIESYEPYYLRDKSASNNYRAFERYLKKAGKLNLTKKEILEEYYYYIRHFFINKHYVRDRFNGKEARFVTAKEFTGHIIYGLIKLEIPYEILVVLPRATGKLAEIIDVAETDYLIKAKMKEPIYFYKPSPFTMFNNYPSVIEGTDCYIVSSPDHRARNLKVQIEELPTTSYQENLNIYESEVKMNEEDPKILDISTKVTYKGHQGNRYKGPLVDWMQMIFDENDRYGSDRWGDPSKASGDAKIRLEEFIASDKERREENFKAVAENHFDVEVKELTHYEAFNTGNTIGESDLKIQFDVQIEDFVNKVGPNYVIKVGSLVGGQLELDETDMERKEDIYMDYARGYEYVINLQIPKGFEVKGLNNFALDVDNETGTIKSSAVVEGDKVVVSLKKYYKNLYEKAENWDKMKAFLIPGAEFMSKELLFKKK